MRDDNTSQKLQTIVQWELASSVIGREATKKETELIIGLARNAINN